MSKSSKLIKKALDNFSEGNLEKAMKLCDKILLEDLNNSAALNLEAHILYIKGDLKAAENNWNINVSFNRNSEAQKHLEEMEKYKEYREIYESALVDINNNEVKSAVEKLTKCEKLEFNIINVKNSLAKCYLLLGDKKKAEKSFEEVLKKDISNSFAREKMQELGHNVVQDKYNKIKGNKDIQVDNKLIIAKTRALVSKDSRGVQVVTDTIKKIPEKVTITIPLRVPVVIASALAVLFLLVGVVPNLFTNKETSKQTAIVAAKTKDQTKTEDTTTGQKNDTSIEAAEVKLSFDSEQFKSAIDGEDYNKLYDLLSLTSKDGLQGEELKLYKKAENLMNEKGVQHFYDLGLSVNKEKKYKEAIDNFLKALKFADGNYLKQHIVYLLAATYENDNDMEKAIEYYITYVNDYKEADYAAQSAYKLVILNLDKNKDVAIKYANLIKSDYSSSMFYNKKIKDLLGQ